MEDMDSKMAHVRNLLSQLPSCNMQLLKRLLCALHHIQKHSERNKMTASNLSLCIAPSLLWHKKKDDPSLSAPAVTFLIDHCVELFGEDVLHLLGEALEPRSADSGTDSESMHSVLSMHDGSNGLPRDDSSMDSLDERDMYMEGGECSPRLAKSHLSPTNLSRDSGLTLSDTQLYDEALDAGDNRGKFYPRSAHHFPDKEYERRSRTLDSRSTSSSAMQITEERFNPVPPPRKRGERRQDEGDADSGHVGPLDPGGVEEVVIEGGTSGTLCMLVPRLPICSTSSTQKLHS
ncbi:rho GTPase-activating protein 20-like isoform X1 [Pomacea canaliculata]|uniref:rho GTPase-activating protein 20-like isoform X1 n=1 Tax=Pomacea canaliculata TaxID=400727 RepID=UPI000D7258E8|nr:rho GTPase-activating protein 20-like isoform X1 [Pomacea canaliculata]